MSSNFLAEQIWREDVLEQEEYLYDLVRVLNDYIVRAHYQQAPLTLLERLTQLRDLQVQVYDGLHALVPYFPSMP